MNKKGIAVLFNPVVIIILVIIVGFVFYNLFKPKPYTLCTENSKEIDNYIKLYDIEIGKRYKEDNNECYETYDKAAYINLINLTNEFEYKKFRDKLELEDKKSQRTFDFLERNKIAISVLIIIVAFIYFLYKFLTKHS